ncbi:hypothetical protein WMY93_004366 [Mugilogobius chulae]|uniref:Cocaine- and amphetamine-regulated transcript protein n=1 Tax=Mugilogobius chulae TaxID=88201 RepID=A0AAW0Q397_9GOBI
MELLWRLFLCLLLSVCAESRPETRPELRPGSRPESEPETRPGPASEQMNSTAPPSGHASYSSDHAPFRPHRLPGLCRRLRRRRITVMCNLDKFCWSPQNQTRTETRPRTGSGSGSGSGQVCLCPRGLRCSHYFIHSL